MSTRLNSRPLLRSPEGRSERLAYDDPASPHEMYADCAAVGGNLPDVRRSPSRFTSPSDRADQPGAEPFHVAVPPRAEHLARTLHAS